MKTSQSSNKNWLKWFIAGTAMFLIVAVVAPDDSAVKKIAMISASLTNLCAALVNI